MTAQTPTILYAGEDERARLAMHQLFQSAGFRIKEAATGGDALRLVEEQPDLVILDVNLPGINGIEVCRRIKAHPATNAIPVLHLSPTLAASADRPQELEDLADSHLPKPVEPQELLAHVKTMLRVRQAEDRARLAFRQWQATVEALGEGVCLLDPEGKVLRCNQTLARIVGLASADAIGRVCHELFPVTRETSDRFPFERMRQTGCRETAELPLGGHWLQVIVEPMWDDTGAFLGAVCLATDITERNRLEEQLQQAQKMQAVGQLAGGVAHDFNNLLTVILGNLALLRDTVPNSGPLATIEKATLRAADLIQQLLDFSRRSFPWLKALDLQGAIEEIVGILGRIIDPRIAVETARVPDLWTVTADPSQLNQVLMNLCINACDAMPEGGRLVLETGNVDLDAQGARSHPDARPGQFVRLRVRDSGHGIPPEVLPRVFDPFVSTKPKGTGLGLTNVARIVKQHQGWVECASTIDEGTTFDVYLPRSATRPEESYAPAANPVPATGTETILLVDDEAMIRDLTQLVLQRAGYQVLLAADGREAVDLYRREGGHIDLVILDLMMPRLSGREVIPQLVQINPAVRVLLASGYWPETERGAAIAGALGFIRKPYRETDLLAMVRSALDQGK